MLFNRISVDHSQTGRRISCYFLADAPSVLLDAFGGEASAALQVVHVPPPPKEDIIRLLEALRPTAEADAAFFSKFVHAIHLAYGTLCGNDVRELAHLVSVLYPAFVAPVLAGAGEIAFQGLGS
jgi:hypothetical protein